MSLTSLVLSAVMLVAANVIVYRLRKPVAPIAILCLLALFVPLLAGSRHPSVDLLALLLLFSLVSWQVSHQTPAFFLVCSLVSLPIALSIPRLSGQRIEHAQYTQPRARNLHKSLEDDRLTIRKPWPATRELNPLACSELMRVEENLSSGGQTDNQELQMKLLHEAAVTSFIHSAGFGVSRMSSFLEYRLASLRSRMPIPLQWGSRIKPDPSSRDWLMMRNHELMKPEQMQVESIFDAVYPEGFGYIKGHRYMAGLEYRHYGEIPESSPIWRVQSLDLISLLIHDEPRVYVSSYLPRMDELHSFRTRPLDIFEVAGLNALRGGEEEWRSRDADKTRMVGAIRNLKQCVGCHGGQRGDLLGAFTYTVLHPRNTKN